VDEFSLINKYFDWDQGIGDDCALISIDHGKQLATTVDTLIEGVHFPASTSAQDIAYKALAVNLRLNSSTTYRHFLSVSDLSHLRHY
jgi:thiamine-monophosphate kinase